MPEGLSTVTGDGLKGHTESGGDEEHEKRKDRTVSIIEALLLAVVAVLAAWSGYAAAKCGTESSLSLAMASAGTGRKPTGPT
jgi:hypothetical protein